MNSSSSRSHAILTLRVETTEVAERKSKSEVRVGEKSRAVDGRRKMPGEQS